MLVGFVLLRPIRVSAPLARPYPPVRQAGCSGSVRGHIPTTWLSRLWTENVGGGQQPPQGFGASVGLPREQFRAGWLMVSGMGRGSQAPGERLRSSNGLSKPEPMGLAHSLHQEVAFQLVTCGALRTEVFTHSDARARRRRYGATSLQVLSPNRAMHCIPHIPKHWNWRSIMKRNIA
ncbi:unnamed protein product [Symbiodinium sp. KB8]|nr:unnamed protein product [Symbiodinium sp. KB8]